MKQLRLMIICLLISGIGLSQKPLIDTFALNSWQSVRGLQGAGISPDGDYLYYTVLSRQGVKSIIVRSVKGAWHWVFEGISEKGFTADNARFVYQSGDSLCFLGLGSGKIESITGIKSISKPRSVYIDWLAWQYKNDPSVLILRQVGTGREQRLTGVFEYGFSDTGGLVLVKGKDSMGQKSLSLVDLSTGAKQTVWQSAGDAGAGAYSFDSKGAQLAFMVKSPAGNSLWYYRPGMQRAEKKADNHSEGLEAGWIISGSAPDFTESGHCLLFKLEQQGEIRKEPQAVEVDIWSYRDVLLPPQQPQNINCKAAIAVTSTKIRSLACERDESVSIVGDIAIVRKKQNPLFDWLDRGKDRYRWISLEDGRQGVLGTGDIRAIYGSPDGQWLFYFDNSRKVFYSYELQSGKTQFISGYKDDVGYGTGGSNSGCSWLTDGRMLIDDGYDIWALDPMGHATENLTGGYGRLHRIQFRRIKDTDWDQPLSPDLVLCLRAFDEKTKYNGFYQLTPGKAGTLERLSLDPCYISITPSWKAQKNVWLVLKESVEKAPNYFITYDFSRYEPITDIQPQQKYNWMTAELIHYRQTDGKPTEAVLYKPENFDSHKKYPVLFLYYETMTEDMYHFKAASYAYSNLNIPWFVSRGYLVCTPDIQYTIGQSGKSACSSVEGAARYLSRLPFVDSLRMGVQGHSFGGYETNYIVTHSRLFRAACTASGPSDLFSWYGCQWGYNTAQYYTEQGQIRMGGPPWERKQQYLDNSPIMSVDKVTTPLLMMANKKDEFNFQQEIELFLYLRRINKKAWLLQYDAGEHAVSGPSALDFTMRLTQFFDHYLKGERAPKWMTEGLPARYKGKLSRLELADVGVEPE
ncbi:MAG: prolyl oligopeptidase family serine peptidase [Bacteroidota bacterium]